MTGREENVRKIVILLRSGSHHQVQFRTKGRNWIGRPCFHTFHSFHQHSSSTICSRSFFIDIRCDHSRHSQQCLDSVVKSMLFKFLFVWSIFIFIKYTAKGYVLDEDLGDHRCRQLLWFAITVIAKDRLGCIDVSNVYRLLFACQRTTQWWKSDLGIEGFHVK